MARASLSEQSCKYAYSSVLADEYQHFHCYVSCAVVKGWGRLGLLLNRVDSFFCGFEIRAGAISVGLDGFKLASI